MRSFDELLATDNVFDWTPDEMRLFIKETATEVAGLRMSLTRRAVVSELAPLKLTVAERIKELSRGELEGILDACNNFESRLAAGEFDSDE